MLQAFKWQSRCYVSQRFANPNARSKRRSNGPRAWRASKYSFESPERGRTLGQTGTVAPWSIQQDCVVEADMSQRASCRLLQKNANRKIIIQNGGMYAWSPTKRFRTCLWYLIKLRQAYNHTFIQWTTHRPEGLSIKDVEMASWCDEQAKLHEERFDVEPAPFKAFDFN